MTQTGATPGERCAACTPAVRTRLDCQSDVWHYHHSKHIISLTSPSLQTHHLSDITITSNTSSLWHHHHSKHIISLTSPSLQTHHLSDITIAPNTSSLWHHHRSKHIISLTSPSLQTHHLSDITIAPNTSSLWHHHHSKHIISQPWVLQISCCQSSSNFKTDVRWLPIVLPAEQSMVCSHLGMGKCKCSEKSETRMTASALKQDPNAWKVKKNSIYCD